MSKVADYMRSINGPKTVGPLQQAIARNRELEARLVKLQKQVKRLEGLVFVLGFYGRADLVRIESEITLHPVEWSELNRIIKGA